MSDPQGPATLPQGPVEEAPDTGITSSTPEVSSGQAPEQTQAPAGQAVTAAPEPETPTFFDVSQVPPELMPAYKMMQGAFTRKTQEISANRQKIEAFDSFMRDPVGQIQQLAAQYGMNVTRAQAAQMAQESQAQQEFNPQTWDDVMSLAEQRVMAKLSPLLSNLQQETVQMKTKSIESQLDQIDPNWRMYEDTMIRNMQDHPSLARDVSKLYRLSVPEEVLMAKATQQALKKIQDKATAAQTSEKGKTSSKPVTKPPTSIAEAWEQAKMQQNQ